MKCFKKIIEVVKNLLYNILWNRKHRFIINFHTKEIHDIRHKTRYCNLDKIKTYARVDENSMKTYMLDGFNGCAHCMPQFDTDKTKKKKL